MSKFWFSIFIICSVLSCSHAQIKINGTVLDSLNQSPIANASVLLFEPNHASALTFSLTDDQGQFHFTQKLTNQVYRIEVRHINYGPQQKTIYLERLDSSTIKIDFHLSKSDFSLEAIEIQSTPPIIVKKDTIIYDINHWSRLNDENLEDVLKKIEGFKILSDGELIVNGKKVNKVIINGEEISDGGAALLTRSISPELIDNVEVRFDEQDNQLKESILDADEFVVLDIKLKKDLKKPYFGNGKGELGYQNSTQVGGNFNGFLLNKKFKLHGFGERNVWGQEEFSMWSIKNLGSSEYDQMVGTPSNFDDFRQRDVFDEQLYGFSSLDKYQYSNLGLTTKINLSEKTSLYLGTFSTDKTVLSSSSQSEYFFKNNLSRLTQNESNQNKLGSRNKIEFRADFDRIKFVSNIQFDWLNTQFSRESIVETLNYEFKPKTKELNVFANLYFEYLVNEKWGFGYKLGLAKKDRNEQNTLNHNNPNYYTYYFDTENNLVNHVKQNVGFLDHSLISDVFVQTNFKPHSIRSGVLYNKTKLNSSRIGLNADNQLKLPEFTSSKTQIGRSTFYEPYVNYSFKSGSFILTNQIGYQWISYPSNNPEIFDQVEKLTYEFRGSYRSTSGSNITFTYNNNVAPFPLAKQFSQSLIYAHDQVQRLDHEVQIIPKNYQIYNLDFSQKLLGGFRLEPMFALVRNQNNNSFQFDGESGLLNQVYNQSKGGYEIYYFTVYKHFDSFPLEIVFAPDWINNFQDNINTDNTTYRTYNNRHHYGIEFRSKFSDSKFYYRLFPEYSLLKFESDLDRIKQIQKRFTLEADINSNLFKEKLNAELATKYLKLYDFETEGTFLLNLNLLYKSEKLTYTLNTYNLTNSKNFIKQEIYPEYYQELNAPLFERYVKFGVEFNLK